MPRACRMRASRMASSTVSPAMNRRAKLSGMAMPYFDASRLSAVLRDKAKNSALEPPYMDDYTVMQNAKFKMQTRAQFASCILNLAFTFSACAGRETRAGDRATVRSSAGRCGRERARLVDDGKAQHFGHFAAERTLAAFDALPREHMIFDHQIVGDRGRHDPEVRMLRLQGRVQQSRFGRFDLATVAAAPLGEEKEVLLPQQLRDVRLQRHQIDRVA